MKQLPAFVNAKSGSAEDAKEVLQRDARVNLHETEPKKLAEAVSRAIAAGANRVIVAGGDGSLAAAAGAVAKAKAEMGVVPGGTMNHFAKRIHLPEKPEEALEVAATAAAIPLDVGYLNDRLFLNTSSIGAYVTFVQVREKWEKRVGHWIASLIAAVRLLWTLDTVRVSIEVDGEEKHYDTPLVFIGVGERELKLPKLGGPVENGERGLHVLIVRGRTRARIVALAFVAAARGLGYLSRTPHIDAFLVDSCTIEAHGERAVAVDGEIIAMDATLEYRLARDELLVAGATTISRGSSPA